MTWQPESEAELVRALAAGDVDENRFIEAKRQPYSKAERREAARDMASFAIDGGAIIFGVDEDKTTGALSPAPFDLADQSERIENIAANAIDPPLPIRVYPIRADSADGTGYLYVEIPPSPLAPHMVDGEYWARSEKTKRRLGDAEVVRLHAQRERVENRVWSALQEERNREPNEKADPDSRMFLVSVPLAAPANVARSFIAGEVYRVVQFSESAEDALAPSVRAWAPSPGYMTSHERRARGIARTNLGAGRLPSYETRTGRMMDLEVQSSGSLRMLVGDTVRVWGGQFGGEGQALICDGLVIAWAHRLVRLSELLAAEVGYRGPWGFGVYVYGLRGLRGAVQANQHIMHTTSTYNEADFGEVTTASLEEMQDRRNGIVARLTGDLALALDSAGRYADALVVPTPPDPDGDA